MELAPGARLGPYEVLAPLGAGGMGQVWRARDTRLARQVAVKIIVHAGAEDPNLQARFEREARALSSLNHPNIVCVYDVGEQDGAQYIVSELVEGEPLRQVIARGPVPAARLLDMAEQIAKALTAAHAAGIVHRDLKPENIMVTPDGIVKILDFGLARRVRPAVHDANSTVTQSTVTQPGAVMGTAGYMSPEQICGEEVDARSDIFSFGVVLYEMSNGERAFRGRTSIETMSAILKDQPAPQRSRSSSGLERIIRRALEKDPAKRFQSAAELSAALAALRGAPKAARLRWIGAGAAMLVCAGGGAYWMANRTPRPAAVVHQVAPAPAPAPVKVETPSKPPVKAAPAAPAEPPSDAAFQQAYQEGMVLLSERRWPQAADRLSKAIRLKPDSGPAYLGRCRAAAAQGDQQQAVTDCGEAIRLMPNSAAAFHERGSAYLLTQQFDRAVEDLNAAIRLGDEDMAMARNLRGRAHSGLREWGDAITDFDEAIRLNPQSPHFYVYRGIAFNNRSQYRKAIDDFTRALEIQPNLPQAHLQRAIARQHTGDAAGAAEDRAQARSLKKQ